MLIDQKQLSEYDTRYRVQLINSLSGFKSANLIGSISSTGQTNLSVVSSVFHIGATPPLVGTIFRPNSVPRHTLENIIATGVYTINQVSAEIYQQAHQTSARYPRELSEFNQTGLTEEYIADITAPFVKESQLKYALRLREQQTLSLNQTELVIGQIESIAVSDTAVKPDGYIDIESLNTVAISGLDSYHLTQRLTRLSYAKPNKPVETLPLTGEANIKE